MFLIVISWIYILSISTIVGITINKSLKIFTIDSIVIVFLGFFGITLFTSFWAIFLSVNWQFHLVLLGITAVALKMNGLSIYSYIANLKKEIKALSPFLKIFLVFVSVLILAQCASAPFLIDNESYYIQTINWLNEYGLVKGLINLHIFLGQTSGWHVLQSAFNFSFLYENFNDLSGLCLLLGNYYAIVKLNSYFKDTSKKHNLIIGLFPLFNVFLFQFISAPSPDIAVYIIAIIVFHEFIENFSTYNKASFLSISILVMFLVYIKLSTIVFILFPLIILYKHFIQAKKSLNTILIIGVLTFVAFIIKNLIVTGNAIYPLPSTENLSISWKLPKHIETYFLDYGNAYGFNTRIEDFHDLTFFERFKNWLLQPNLHGLFNNLMLFLLLILPVFIWKNKLNKSYIAIYVVAIINMFFLLSTSPQYRFFLPFIIILSLLIFAYLIKKRKVIYSGIVMSLLLAVIPMFTSINMSRFTSTEAHQTSSNFSLNYIIKPHCNSKYSDAFEAIELKNTTINSPTSIDFFWGTGNVKPPALNKVQLDYFRRAFKVIPQQRTDKLKDGFYSKFSN